MAIFDNHHEAERGCILQILMVRYPDPISFSRLYVQLIGQGQEATERDLRFHLYYLQQKGYVMLEKLSAGRAEIEMQTVRLSARGVDLLDRRIDADPGITF